MKKIILVCIFSLLAIAGVAKATNITTEQPFNTVQSAGVIELLNNASSGIGLHITHTGTNNSQGLIRLDGFAPEMEMVETDCKTGSNCDWEIRVQDDRLAIDSRNIPDTAFERSVEFTSLKNGGGLQIIPTAHPTTRALVGSMYVDSDSNELCFYNGSIWIGISQGGQCD